MTSLITICYLFSFLISSIDVPYFSHFNYRLTTAVFQWIENPMFVLKMVFQEPSYWGILVPLIIIVLAYRYFIKKLKHLCFKANENHSFSLRKKIVWFVCLSLMLILGFRGRINFNVAPLGPTDAYFSDYSITNQMALNPVFTFLKSYFDTKKESNKELQLMDNDLAIHNVKQYLNREGNYHSPIAKNIIPDSSYTKQPNLVLILMEGMSTARMGTYGNPFNITPFLDSISNQGYFFKNLYSAGIHTHNGIYGTLCSYPALYDRHAMNQVPILKYNNLISNLKKNGYSTTYFTNHDVEFDNVGGFLTENGIDNIVCDKDYPKNKILSTLGVADDFMFDFSLPVISEMAQKDTPFLAVFMTTSNHGPYRIPSYFKSKHKTDELAACEYADWSLNKFIADARKQSWFSNTVFAFVADHGWAIDVRYDLSLNYNHIPFLIYAPNLITSPKLFNKIGGQIDVYPTLMNLLKLPYTNTTLGIDLFTESRPFMYFNADDKIGVIDDEHLLILRKEGPETMHLYQNKSVNNCIEENKEKAEAMKKYAFSNMQAAYYLMSKNKVGDE
ncbi:MAG: sulfatase-like hydrolase/transferase [Flavobacteriales bacterium]|nr:sulfatase-like hydrolase/transferase [Flavobacteriales bacterium]MCB9363926.1 sulfatase-like hydrolase/transferase [Flavobacteriales bacterium]